MREVIVPVDLVSEVKNIMGKVSTRQLVYLAIGGVISYRIIIYAENPLPGLAMYIFNLILSLPVLAAAGGLAFIYLGRYDMYLDKYLLYWWLARKQAKVWYYHASLRKLSVGGEGWSDRHGTGRSGIAYSSVDN